MGAGLNLVGLAAVVAIVAVILGAFDNAHFGWEVPSVTDVRFKFTSFTPTSRLNLS